MTARCVVLAALLTAALAPAQEAGRRYALLVGVRDYKGTDLSNLKYTENDVTALETVLKSNGYKRVVLMTKASATATDNDDLRPTAENIRAQIKGILEDLRPADSVLIAFAGHGVQLQKPAGLFFCPQKADLKDPTSLVSLSEVYESLSNCKAGTKLVFVDACRNNPLSGRSATVANLRSATRPDVPQPPGGVAVLFSCSKNQKAFESEKLQHGVFFYHVIQGLKGKAAGKGGEVDLLGLAKYAVDEVRDSVKDEFGPSIKQVPNLVSNVNGSPALTRTVAVASGTPALKPPTRSLDVSPKARERVPPVDSRVLSLAADRSFAVIPESGDRRVHMVATVPNPSRTTPRFRQLWSAEAEGLVGSLAAHPDGTRVYVGDDRGVGCYDTADGKLRFKAVIDGGRVGAMAVHPDGKSLAAGNGLAVGLLDPTTGKVLWSAPGKYPVASLAFAPRGAAVIVGGGDVVASLDAATGKVRWARELLGEAVVSLSIRAGLPIHVETKSGRVFHVALGNGQVLD